jgi:2,4-dienoyl-CoA reductase-like NADH-dependent reductase (Old Yellow Enzyme family)
MALTRDQHADLATRLEVLIGEFAAASDRSKAVGQLREILARVPPSDETASDETGPSLEQAKAMVDEIDRRGVALSDLTAAKATVEAELVTTKQQLADAQAALEAARKTAAPATPASPDTNHQ